MKKTLLLKFFSIALAICVLVASAVTGMVTSASTETWSTWDGTSASTSLSGTGTDADPYLIQSAADLAYWSSWASGTNNFAGKYVKLTTNIDLADKAFGAIHTFAGVLDGNGYEIKGINISLGKDNTGFFRILKGTVKNLTLTGKVVETNNVAIGGFVGLVNDAGATIENCVNNINVTGKIKVGGFIGEAQFATQSINITKCINNGNINSTVDYTDTAGSRNRMGGFIGYATANVKTLVIKNSVNNGNVTKTVGTQANGLAGFIGDDLAKSTTIDTCINTGNITGIHGLGGIVGRIDGAAGGLTIKNTINVGKITVLRAAGNGANSAALIAVTGSIAPTISNSYHCLEDIDNGAATPSGNMNRGTATTKAALKDGTVLALLSEGLAEPVWVQGENYPVLAWTVPAPEEPECEHETTKDAIIEEATYFKAGLKNVVCADDACGAMVETDVVIPEAEAALTGDFTETFADGKLTIAFEYSDALALDILDGAKISFNYSINGYTKAVELSGETGETVILEGFNADRLNADLTYNLSAVYGDVDTAKLNAVGGTVKAAEVANDEKLDALLEALEADAVVNGTVANSEWLVSNTAKLDLKAATAELRITASQKLIDTLATLGKEGRTVTLTVKVGDITKTFTLEKLYKVTIINVSGLSFELMNGEMSAQLNIDYEGADNDILTDEIVFACGDMIANADTAAANAFAAYMSK